MYYSTFYPCSLSSVWVYGIQQPFWPQLGRFDFSAGKIRKYVFLDKLTFIIDFAKCIKPAGVLYWFSYCLCLSVELDAVKLTKFGIQRENERMRNIIDVYINSSELNNPVFDLLGEGEVGRVNTVAGISKKRDTMDAGKMQLRNLSRLDIEMDELLSGVYVIIIIIVVIIIFVIIVIIIVIVIIVVIVIIIIIVYIFFIIVVIVYVIIIIIHINIIQTEGREPTKVTYKGSYSTFRSK